MLRLPVLPLALIWGIVLVNSPALAGIDDDARRAAADKIEGRKAYQAFCASCHGAAGAGEASAGGNLPDFTTPQAVVTFDAERMVAGVEGKHSAETKAKWKDKLSPDEATRIISFMREAFMLPAPTVDASRGRAIFAKTCTVCHGDRGNGATWARNSLNPSPFDFSSPKAKELTRRHMINTVTYGSPKTAMVGFSTQLSREDIAAVVDYVRATFIYPETVPETGNEAGGRLSYGNRVADAKGHGAGGPGGGGAIAGRGQSAGPADMSLPFPNGLKGDVKWGKRFFNENCYVCHGKEGRGDGPRAYFIQPKPANLTSIESRQSLNRPQLLKSISMGSNGSEMPAWSKVLTEQEITNVAEYVFATFISSEAPASAEASQKKNK